MHIEVGGFPDNLGGYIFPICYIKHEGRIVMRDKRIFSSRYDEMYLFKFIELEVGVKCTRHSPCP